MFMNENLMTEICLLEIRIDPLMVEIVENYPEEFDEIVFQHDGAPRIMLDQFENC